MPRQKKNAQLSESSVQFLEGIASKTRGLADHIDSQTNILIGISSAIFLFSFSRVLNGDDNLAFFVLGFFAGLSAVVGLFAVHPPKFMRKQGQTESVLYNKNIAGFSSAKEYGKKLDKVLDDREEVIQQYATEIYNLAKYLYRPKRNLFYVARNFLMVGILASLIVFLAELF